MNQWMPYVAVVDDDDSVGRAIKRLLRANGLAAQTFATGKEFLRMFDSTPSHRPACIVLDVQLPDLNGLEVQQRLAGSRAQVIFITAHEGEDISERAMEAGAVAYFRKPFDDVAFIEAVRAAIAPAGR
ncbi:response regulator transcription factor [Bordetella genomosp. 13]|uniref:Response regulator n=1 Tax=Bordetella genomosp. 13 TaxID=463040 RepID=A0A1W6Z9H9_9BORD|nr:response regulator [Bordetella genomosp. 13]ARP93810.1 response regulator [Bordetella genomosp. 13]